MKHNTNIDNYKGSTHELVVDLSNLRYDALSDFFFELSEKIEYDAFKDRKREYVQLATALSKCSQKLKEASHDMAEAWKVSKDHMDD